jgi:hypothetical protein
MSQLIKWFVFFGFFLSFSAHGQLLENYDGQWKSAQEESWLSSNEQIELDVDLVSFPESELRLRIPAQSTIFVNGRLWILTKSDTVIYKKTADLRTEFGTDRAVFTVVSSNLASFQTGVWKVLGRMDSSLSPERTEEQLLQSRFVVTPIRDFYFSVLFLILVFLALYKLAYPYLLAVMIQPLSVINAEDFSESGNLQKFFSFDILFYILIVAMTLSLGTVTGLVLYRREWLENWVGLDYASLLMIWLLGSLAILVLTMLKFIGIRILSYLFDLGKAEFSHFFYLLRLIVFGTTIVILIGAYFMSNDFPAMESTFRILMKGFFWFYILGVGGLFLIMMSRLSFKKYHLFTYLCIAELVPFLILAKWIMVLGQ